MNDKYEENVILFKALADINRLMIVDMLSCGELCACKILEKLGIAQPTLSHHMKILCDSGFVISRKDGRWTHYSLNGEMSHKFISFIRDITTTHDVCICMED